MMCNLGTWLFTKFYGKYVGSDEFGNKYYQSTSSSREFGRKHRWVIYKGDPEATKVPPQWFSWLHYQTDTLPMNNKKHNWEKNHIPNLTGTKHAYSP